MEITTTCSTANSTILACQKIVQSLNENIYELSLIRTDWTAEYARQLKSRIKSAQTEYLPEQTFCKHTAQQQYVHQLMISSLKDISIFRALIKVEFKEDLAFQKQIFEELGYNDFFSDAKNGDYHSLYFLLKEFNKNITPEIREKIRNKTIPESLIDRLINYHQEMQEFKFCFDLINESSRLSPEGKQVINEIFSEIKDICRIATAYFMLDPLKRDQFSFFRVLHGLNKILPETIYSK